MSTWLLYGCTGYTGKLIVAEAAARGERPVLAGRNAELPHMYRITSDLAVDVARRVTAGRAEPGYRTPAGVFGSAFITEFDGCELVAR